MRSSHSHWNECSRRQISTSYSTRVQLLAVESVASKECPFPLESENKSQIDHHSECSRRVAHCKRKREIYYLLQKNFQHISSKNQPNLKSKNLVNSFEFASNLDQPGPCSFNRLEMAALRSWFVQT